jgi:RHS repeat-associated protein
VAVSTNKFLWDGQALAEQRDRNNNVTKRFFGQGEQISGVNYYFTRDHLGSVREVMNTAGVMLARYDYDPYGRMTVIAGSFMSDFGYAGMYYHTVSGLNLTLYRAYDSDLGRWLSRDPLAEKAGLNLYAYVANNVINAVDPNGRILVYLGIVLGVLALGGLVLVGYAMYNAVGEASVGSNNQSIAQDHASSTQVNGTPTQNGQSINNALAIQAPDFFTMATMQGGLAGGPAGFIPDNAGDAAISLAWSALQPDSSGTPSIVAPYLPDSSNPSNSSDPSNAFVPIFLPLDVPFSPFGSPMFIPCD